MYLTGGRPGVVVWLSMATSSEREDSRLPEHVSIPIEKRDWDAGRFLPGGSIVETEPGRYLFRLTVDDFRWTIVTTSQTEKK